MPILKDSFLKMDKSQRESVLQYGRAWEKDSKQCLSLKLKLTPKRKHGNAILSLHKGRFLRCECRIQIKKLVDVALAILLLFLPMIHPLHLLKGNFFFFFTKDVFKTDQRACETTKRFELTRISKFLFLIIPDFSFVTQAIESA